MGLSRDPWEAGVRGLMPDGGRHEVPVHVCHLHMLSEALPALALLRPSISISRSIHNVSKK